MDRVLVYEDQQGRCRIVWPSPKFQQPWESEEDAIARLHAVAIPDVTEFFACKKAAMPQDSTFREAWKKGDAKEPVKVDMDKAKALHRERLRLAAERKIQCLELELTKALERDNTPEAVAIRHTKKILRTIHEMDLSHCKTPEDIKYSVPKELRDVWPYYQLP